MTAWPIITSAQFGMYHCVSTNKTMDCKHNTIHYAYKIFNFFYIYNLNKEWRCQFSKAMIDIWLILYNITDVKYTHIDFCIEPQQSPHFALTRQLFFFMLKEKYIIFCTTSSAKWNSDLKPMFLFHLPFKLKSEVPSSSHNHFSQFISKFWCFYGHCIYATG